MLDKWIDKLCDMIDAVGDTWFFIFLFVAASLISICIQYVMSLSYDDFGAMLTEQQAQLNALIK